jgi:general stress protein 26
MSLSANQAECLALIESIPFVDFSTIGKEGFPSTRLMMNLRNKGQFPPLSLYEKEKPLTVFLTTHRVSEKMDEIGNDAKASLYFCDPVSFRSVLLMGSVEIVTDETLRQKAWRKEWERHYPNPNDDYVLLRFVPKKLKASLGASAVAETL